MPDAPAWTPETREITVARGQAFNYQDLILSYEEALGRNIVPVSIIYLVGNDGTEYPAQQESLSIIPEEPGPREWRITETCPLGQRIRIEVRYGLTLGMTYDEPLIGNVLIEVI